MQKRGKESTGMTHDQLATVVEKTRFLEESSDGTFDLGLSYNPIHLYYNSLEFGWLSLPFVSILVVLY